MAQDWSRSPPRLRSTGFRCSVPTARSSFGRRTVTTPIPTRPTCSSRTGSTSSFDPDLRQVVLQMRHVVAHEIVEGRRFLARNRAPRQLVEIMSCPRANTFVLRHSLHDARDVEVEIAPQRNQFVPGRVPISLHRYPRVLLVTRKNQVILKLCPYETLVV